MLIPLLPSPAWQRVSSRNILFADPPHPFRQCVITHAVQPLSNDQLAFRNDAIGISSLWAILQAVSSADQVNAHHSLSGGPSFARWRTHKKSIRRRIHPIERPIWPRLRRLESVIPGRMPCVERHTAASIRFEATRRLNEEQLTV